MGYCSDLFDSPPDENILCAICHDVFEDPYALLCGHTFCKLCLSQLLVDLCPSCRQENVTSTAYPSRAVRGLIGNLIIRCKNNMNPTEATGAFSNPTSDHSNAGTVPPLEERPCRRRRGENGPIPITAAATASTPTASLEYENPPCEDCPWRGKLCDWEAHSLNDCQLRRLKCEWCPFEGRPNELRQHMMQSSDLHMKIAMERMGKEFEGKLKQEMKKLRTTLDLQLHRRDREMQADIDALHSEFATKLQQEIVKVTKECEQRVAENNIHMYLSTFCRHWMACQPDVLQEFVVYRPTRLPITMLLCGIPGPNNSHWEGGLFPVVIQWSDMKQPPRCFFPMQFHHVNCYDSGLCGNAYFREDEAWHPELSVPEILFLLQQFLGHPDKFNPCQLDAYRCFMLRKLDYDAKARAAVTIYPSDGSFLTRATMSNFVLDVGGPQDWKLVHDNHTNSSADVPSSRDGDCDCSCCNLTKSYRWDKSRTMRYLPGTM